jgi:hypothetical protein
MSSTGFRLVLSPNDHARLVFQELRNRLFEHFGLVSSQVWEPCVPLAVSTGVPPKASFVPLAYRCGGDPPPAFRITGAYTGPEGVYLEFDDRDSWEDYARFCRRALHSAGSGRAEGAGYGLSNGPGSDAQPAADELRNGFPAPYPGLFLCAPEDRSRESEIRIFIEDHLPGLRTWRSSKLTAFRMETDTPEAPWETARWKPLWRLAVRRSAGGLLSAYR